MIAVLIFTIPLLFATIGAVLETVSRHRIREDVRIHDAVERAAAKVLPKPKSGNFVKIGSMNAPFSAVMHSCDVESMNSKNFEVGDVVACGNANCGKQWIMGWFLSSNPANNILNRIELADKKRWISLEQYEKNPGEYVYSK